MEKQIMDKDLIKIIKPPKGKQPPSFSELTSVFGIDIDDVIFNALNVDAVSSDTPIVLILTGAPGSGKSTIKTKLLDEYQINNYVNVDPDEIRTILESNGVIFTDKFMSKVTNTFNQRLVDYCLKNKFNIVFDTTGRNYTANKNLINDSRLHGYKSVFSMVYVSKETSLKRIKERNEKILITKDGRKPLDENIAINLYDDFMRPSGTPVMYLIKYPVYPDVLMLYENENIPTLLFKGLLNEENNGYNADVVNEFNNFYTVNIIQQTPYFTTSSQSGGKRRKLIFKKSVKSLKIRKHKPRSRKHKTRKYKTRKQKTRKHNNRKS